MKISFQPMLCRAVCVLLAACLFPYDAFGQGIPEPSLIIYGTVRNAADGNIRLTAGTRTWQFSEGGRTNTLTATLTNINDQFSYLLRVPWETDIGSGVSSNALRLLSSAITYDRSQAFFD